MSGTPTNDLITLVGAIVVLCLVGRWAILFLQNAYYDLRENMQRREERLHDKRAAAWLPVEAE